MKKRFSYNLELKCGLCRSDIRLHVLCSLIFDLHCPQTLSDSSSVWKELKGKKSLCKRRKCLLLHFASIRIFPPKKPSSSESSKKGSFVKGWSARQ